MQYWDKAHREPINPNRRPAHRLLIEYLEAKGDEGGVFGRSKLEKLSIGAAFAWLITKGYVKE